MRIVAALVLLLSLAAMDAARAVQPDEILSDQKLEARARAISRDLRCMVCQNQSIDDSDAPLARDLRLLVRRRLEAGDSDDQVRKFLVDRYGAFVLLKPPFELQTLLLWGLPPLVLVGGAIMLVMTARRRTPPSQVPALTVDEEKRLSTLVESDRGTR
jgi:cytochrome c-type biogenesis protein CcmH